MRLFESLKLDIGKRGKMMQVGDDGCAGVLFRDGVQLKFIMSFGLEWEHVSVSMDRRCPTWDEMDFVKRFFWKMDECVVQYHPPLSEYVNHHPYCLHLWRPTNDIIPMPPLCCV